VYVCTNKLICPSVKQLHGLALFRVEFAFELATTKNAGRVFLFAASTAEDRRMWMSKLGRVLVSYFDFVHFSF